MTSRPPSADERRQTPPGQPLAVPAAPHKGETRVSVVFTAPARAIPPEGLTLQDLLARLGERGLLLVCILVTVPFLLPVSIPGSSIPFGVIIALNGISLLIHRAPWLPGRLRHRRLAADALFGVCARGARLFTRLERFIHPRIPPLTHGPTMGRVNGLLLVLSGVSLTNCNSSLACRSLRAPYASTCPSISIELQATACRRSAGARSCATTHGTSSSVACLWTSPQACRPCLYASYSSPRGGGVTPLPYLC